MPVTSIYSTPGTAAPSIANDIIRSYAVYVLEASTSNRLTYFLPPLVCVLPPRLYMPFQNR
jgi:hypothetical protein